MHAPCDVIEEQPSPIVPPLMLTHPNGHSTGTDGFGGGGDGWSGGVGGGGGGSGDSDDGDGGAHAPHTQLAEGSGWSTQCSSVVTIEHACTDTWSVGSSAVQHSPSDDGDGGGDPGQSAQMHPMFSSELHFASVVKLAQFEPPPGITPPDGTKFGSLMQDWSDDGAGGDGTRSDGDGGGDLSSDGDGGDGMRSDGDGGDMFGFAGLGGGGGLHAPHVHPGFWSHA